MRIGIILHGPEIVDVGSAKKIIDLLGKEHDIAARLGGTMGRTAVLDAGLEKIIDISKGLTPSEVINEIRDDIDIAVLLNNGKTLETGRFFGSIVASKLDNLQQFVHIERPDCRGRIIYYHPGAKRYAEYIGDFLKANDEKYHLQVEKGIPEPSNVRVEGECTIRKIAGGLPGENIRIDGIVIGKIIDPDIEIICRDGKILSLVGVKEKSHGLEKLKKRKIDLFTAKVKTGGIRRTNSKPRIASIGSGKTSERIALIDHAAESTFELVRGAGLVITIGDDTTNIAADILVRLGIPVIGIIDGDMDCILENTSVPEGSMIIRVQSGYDDIVGKKVSDVLMRGKQPIMHNIAELKEKILALCEKCIVEVTYY